MLILHKNTYVLIKEADDIVNGYYNPTHPLAVYWSVLEDREKENFLRKALAELEALMLSGCKTFAGQSLNFPRNGAEGVPEAVKQAQVEVALALLDAELGAAGDRQFKMMQALGVVKNTKYSKREQGEVGLGESITGLSAKPKLLPGDVAEKLMRPFLGGTFRL